MAKNEMFDSAVRSTDDLAGVFEYDGDTGYFYLYNSKNEPDKKIIAAIRVLSGIPDFKDKDVVIRWDSTESNVGLFIHGQLWAVFDGRTGAKYGGSCRDVNQPLIPIEIANAFE